MKRQRKYSRVTRQALSTLGLMIRTGRIERGISVKELAERAGISRTTLYNIEKGATGPEVGTVFEIAALVGVPLIAESEGELTAHRKRLENKLAVLPSYVRAKSWEVDDDF